MVPLVLIRPEPGCSTSALAARAQGMEAHAFPLFEVAPRSWEAPDPTRFDALLAGSGNVFRHGGPALHAFTRLPVYAVGDTTAQAARDAGFTVVQTGVGGLQALIGQLDGAHRRLLRLAGDERVPLTLPHGAVMEERVVYETRARPMPAELIALLREPAIIALHSADAARHLAAQCVSAGIRRAPLRIAALSQRIGSAAGDGWGEVAVPALPNDAALLALARQMCQDPFPAGRAAR